MKHLKYILLILLLSPLKAWACDVCNRRQPEALQNVIHGIGPQGNIDYIITTTAAIIVGITLFFSIKYLVKPKEDQADHVKNIVVNKN